jgi:ATP-dependent phosphofructokinase / diphosphate-dependent phosphofructokinase
MSAQERRLTQLSVERDRIASAMLKRLGILTGGGDAPGLNAVIRAVVRTAERVYGAETVGVLDGFSGLIEERFRHLTGADVRPLISLGGTVLGTTNRDNPFAYRREGRTTDRSGEALANAAQAGLEALIVIGGDGTLRIASQLAALGLQVVGVPKTIDNDLAATDYTFGFWTAIEVATDALDRLRDTAESHHRVMVLEVMGRDAGWIALHAGLAGAADVILIPEIPYDLEAVAAAVERCSERGRAYSIVVVAEGAVPRGGLPAVQEVDPVSGNARLGGAGERLRHDLHNRVRCEVRVTVLGHVQRGGSPVPFDRVLATQFGERAVHLAMAGRFGRMVRLEGDQVNDVELGEAVAKVKLVDPTGALVHTARSLGVAFGDEAA